MGGLSTSFMRIVLLVIPGIAARMVYRRLVDGPARRDWEEYLSILLFAILSYATYSLFRVVLINIITESPSAIETLNAMYMDESPVNWMSILWATAAGVVLAFPLAAIENCKFITKLGRCLGITKKYGDEDVWSYLHNSKGEIEWVVVRDHKSKLTYYGSIRVFSDSGKKRELFLKDVDVCSEEGKELYSLWGLYISRSDDDLSIEIPEL